nr:hypothetical protein [Tanacetum cinerariifolium]
MTFEEVKAKFNSVWKQMEDFIHMGLKEDAERIKRKGLNLEQESAKKQKTSEEVPEEAMSPEEVPKEKSASCNIQGQRNLHASGEGLPSKEGSSTCDDQLQASSFNWSIKFRGGLLGINAQGIPTASYKSSHWQNNFPLPVKKVAIARRKKDCSKSKSVTKNNVSNDFSKPVTAQILPPNRVISSTSVSRPQLKSNPMEDRVMLNKSQGKKQEVEDHRWKVKHFRGMTFEEVKAKFNSVWKQMEDFIPMGSKEDAERIKRKAMSPEEVPKEKITRFGGSSASYQFFIDLLKHLDREDLNQLWRLVKETLSNRPPTSDKEMELWAALSRLYEPNNEDQSEESYHCQEKSEATVRKIALLSKVKKKLIVERYIDQRMNEAVKVAVQIQSDRLRDEAKAENEEFLNNLDENIQKIIKEQAKEQTSYAVAADLFEMELKNILIEKMESNKSIHQSDEQRNLYKALADAYECDKIILDTYGDTVMLKRRRDDKDKDKEPSTGSDRGYKRRREGKEPESTSAPKEKATKTTGKYIKGSKSHQTTASESAPAEEPMQTTQDLEEPSHQEFETGVADDQPMAEASQHPKWPQQQKKPPTLDPGLTYELMKGSCKSLVELEFFLEEVYKTTTDQLDWNNPEGKQYPHNLLKPLPLIPNSRGRYVIPFDHFINNDLEYLRGDASSRKYTTFVTKTKAVDYGHIKWIEDLFYGFAVNRESARDVYSKRRIIAVTELQIVEWHNYKHLDWITVRRDDDNLYKFKEGDFKRLLIQDIKDMLLLLVQGKLTNLTVEERFAFNISLRMFIRSIIIQRRVEDLQLAKDEEDHAMSGEVYWWEIARGRLQDTTTDHMIYHMMSLSYKVPTEMELILEHTQQGISHEFSVSAEGVEE